MDTGGPREDELNRGGGELVLHREPPGSTAIEGVETTEEIEDAKATLKLG
jgi:hypothetical protein